MVDLALDHRVHAGWQWNSQLNLVAAERGILKHMNLVKAEGKHTSACKGRSFD